MSAILILAVFVLAVYKLFSRSTVKFRRASRYGEGKVAILKSAPGPVALPIIGNLHLLGKHKSPFQAFTELSKEWGDIFSLTLGSSKCLVVNNLELIREVLNQNGKFFGGRPDFLRFHKLFAGDRNNSLALCDWSNLQTRRRNLARRHCGPKQHTDNFARIGSVATFESIELLQTLKHMSRTTDGAINIKPVLMKSAMNMFSHYMCNVRFDENDAEFTKIVDHFDEIFWEINQGYAVDFLPWLAPFYKKHMQKLSSWSQDIRSFILSRIVEQRELNLDVDAPEKDFLDGLLRVLHDDPTVDRNTIIFMLEDFLGGHSSVGNLVMLCLTAVARDPEVGRKVRAEIESVTKGKRAVSLTDRNSLPYTEATILECLRYASSPIVPHVATENTAVAGYGVEKGTIVFFNNYELNMSDEYWSEPEKFDPSRFLDRSKVRCRRNSQCDSGMESDSERWTSKSTETEKEVVSVRRNIPHFLPFSIALALCDWSNLQTRRRNLARRHCGPKQHTDNFARIGSVATFESIELLQTLKHMSRTTDGAINIKPVLMKSAMNMFSHYMCNVRFDENDAEFTKIVDHFDEIFWEINQGYAVDFLPWLAPFYKKHMQKLSSWSQDIRSFILSRIVEQRELNLDVDAPEKDFLDGLLRVLHDDPTVDRNTIIFMLEDFLGGHSSVGNLVMLCLTAVARDPEVGRKVRAEIESVTKGKRAVSLTDRNSLPYTEATILECLRYASSPIVPHVATENTAVAGYGVEKGTIVFFNNYELNMSDEYWSEPEKFDPSRFLDRSKVRCRRNSQCDSGMESDSERWTSKSTETEKEVVSVRRNIPHFLPFSIGKRTCIGQTLVTSMSFTMFANIIQEFDIRAECLDDLRQKPACVALPKDTYSLHLIPRK